MRDIADTRFVKCNYGKIKPGKKPEAKGLLEEWFARLEKKVNGLKGFAILDGLTDETELLVVTFWETRQAMDDFYSADNPLLIEHVRESDSVREQIPERRDYAVTALRL
jgi:heme-degrading monooxygenase HmoA